jgi:aryl-alcohol dehydrogenase-like predicted oxidoreductase
VPRAQEIATHKLGLDLGRTLIDTAEMYGEGRAEAACRRGDRGPPRRSISHQQGLSTQCDGRRGGAPCECSLERLRTDRLDLYLLHWRGTVPLAETMAAFMGLQAAGKIRHYGASNLDLAALQELWQAPVGPAIATNQLLYTLAPRGIEKELLRGCASGACRSWPIHPSSRPDSRAIRSSLNSHKLST